MMSEADDRLPAALGDFSPIDFAAELNEEQHAAVTSPDGPALVLAGAGSGKTRTLTYRVAYLILRGVQPGEILLLTFTNKAAREMLRRVEDLTGVPARRFWGGTFHSVGQRTLRMYGETVGLKSRFNILDQSDAEALLNEVARTHDAKFFKRRENPKARVIMEVISYARNTRRGVRETIQEKYPWFDFVLEPLVEIARLYREAKLAQQVADYDDLLVYWLRVLEENPDAAGYFARRFQHVLVDEYQDTNALQSAIVDRIAEHHNVMAVGDDAQCIYTWRGADFENIMTFPDRHPGTVIHKIETNYRSTPEILQFANGVLQSQPAGAGYSKELRAVRASRATPYVVAVMDTRHQAQFCIGQLERLLDEGYRYQDIAFLYRAHYQALDLQVELSRRQIPFVITSGVRFFEQAHIRDVVAQLRFAANPADATAFYRIANLLPRVGERTSQRLYKLAHAEAEKAGVSVADALTREAVVAKVPADAREPWSDMALTLQQVANAFADEKPRDLVRIVIEGWYGDFIQVIHTNWQSRKDDLESLVGFAQRFDEMTELLTQLVLLNSETSDRSYDPDEEALRLTTIHQAKGLEYPVVFVIGMADGLLPLRRAIENEDVEEERRLFYVAVTRAQDELYMVYPRIINQGGGAMQMPPSRFLSALPRGSYELIKVQASPRGWY